MGGSALQVQLVRSDTIGMAYFNGVLFLGTAAFGGLLMAWANIQIEPVNIYLAITRPSACGLLQTGLEEVRTPSNSRSTFTRRSSTIRCY